MESQKKKNKISESIIISREELTRNRVFPNEVRVELEEAPFYLLIFVPRTDLVKINCFPVENKEILKLLISLEEFSPNLVKGISNIIKEVLKSEDILHTTGLCFEQKNCFYETYLKAETLDSAAKERVKKDFLALDKVKSVTYEPVKLLSD
jgi:hypothetical protein